MKTGLFIDPSGRECQLVAGNETEFRVLVTRKLANGWRRGPSSPRVEPLVNETQVALPPPAPPPALVDDPPVMAVPASVREAAIAEAQARMVAAAAAALEDRGIGTDVGKLNTALMGLPTVVDGPQPTEAERAVIDQLNAGIVPKKPRK